MEEEEAPVGGSSSYGRVSSKSVAAGGYGKVSSRFVVTGGSGDVVCGGGADEDDEAEDCCGNCGNGCDGVVPSKIGNNGVWLADDEEAEVESCVGRWSWSSSRGNFVSFVGGDAGTRRGESGRLVDSVGAVAVLSGRS